MIAPETLAFGWLGLGPVLPAIFALGLIITLVSVCVVALLRKGDPLDP